ncbi:hypothetical protein JQN58_15840 [Aneurinibacillus sp. BA2021]|nr:hypothetical protein [Aneurinibacillus sp. BA2021]
MLLYRILNPLFYYLRSRVRWRRAGYAMANPGVTVDFSGESYAQWKRLCQAYPVQTWVETMDRPLFMRNLTMLDWLDQLRTALPSRMPACSWLDIGSKNLDYVYAFRAFQEGLGAEQKTVTGIELDGYRIYRDWHSRYDHAMYHAEQTGSRYVVGDVLNTPLPPADMVTLFFPFVSIKPLLLWGLASREYRPQAVYERAAALTRPGGWLLIVNQGEEEADKSRRLLLQCQGTEPGLRLQQTGRFTCRVVDYPARAYYFLLQKDESKKEKRT